MKKVIILIFFMSAIFGIDTLSAQDKIQDGDKKVRVVYPKNTRLQFEGLNIDGELKNPGEFYFQTRKQEKFNSLLSRRKEFHREMLRDVVNSK